MTYNEYLGNSSLRKHFDMCVSHETFEKIKMAGKFYKNISPIYYECFKRVILLYSHKSPNLGKELNRSFKCAFGLGDMDIVEEIMCKTTYITTYFFRMEYLNPRKTNRKKFESELIKHLRR